MANRDDEHASSVRASHVLQASIERIPARCTWSSVPRGAPRDPVKAGRGKTQILCEMITRGKSRMLLDPDVTKDTRSDEADVQIVSVSLYGDGRCLVRSG